MQPQDRRAAGYHYRTFGTFRLILAAMVMLQHYAADLAPAPLTAALAPYFMGSMAVLAFFALSGFVITEAADCIYRDRPGAFLTNRLLRIVPHFLLAVALSILAHELFRLAGGVRLWRSQPTIPDDAFLWSNIISNFAGVVPTADRFIDYNFLVIAWAVRIEMAFYLVIFACLWLTRLLPAQFRGPRGLPLLAGAAAVLLAPLFYLALQGRGLSMLGFLPFFTFGAGLYFASTGRRTGWLAVGLSVPAMIWQYFAQQPVPALAHVTPPAITGNLILLLALLGIMTMLAFIKITKFRRADQWFGNLTYPLYLYHENVMIVMLTFTVGYHYSTFIAGLALSFVIAATMMAVVDPAVTRYRDRVRGRSLRNAPVPSDRLNRLVDPDTILPAG